MTKKGFTLVELLAVIVILAIILAIAIPSITSLIANSSKNSFESDAKMVLKAISLKTLENNTYNPSTLTESNIATDLKLSPTNYKTVKVVMVSGVPNILIVGQNKFANLVAVGTSTNLLVQENLYSWYNFTNRTNTDANKTVAVDLSGNSHDGSLLNFAYDTTSGYNDGLLFDGADDSISIPWKPTDNFSVAMWFYKVDFGPDPYESLLGGPGGFELEAKPSSTNTNKLVLYSWGGGQADYTLSTWTHVVMVRTPSNTKLYVNGVLKLTGSAGSNPNGQYYLGSWSNATAQNYKGKMNNILIYNQALNDQEVLDNYNAGYSGIGNF